MRTQTTPNFTTHWLPTRQRPLTHHSPATAHCDHDHHSLQPRSHTNPTPSVMNCELTLRMAFEPVMSSLSQLIVERLRWRVAMIHRTKRECV